MKNLFSALKALMLVAIIISCNSDKKSSENQSVTAPSDSSTAVMDQAKPAEGMQSTDKPNNDSLTGEQVVNNAANRLITKLGLVQQQEAAIKDILMKTFVAKGEDIKKVYTPDQSRTVGREIIQGSKDQIMGMLNDSQKEQFRNYGHHDNSGNQ
jgi:hypothetical protein